MRSRIGFLTANPCRHGPSSQRRLGGVIVFRTAADSRRPYLAAVRANTHALTQKPHLNQDFVVSHVRHPPPAASASRPITRVQPEQVNAIIQIRAATVAGYASNHTSL